MAGEKLYCDLGNTRLKWRLEIPHQELVEGVYVHSNSVSATMDMWQADLLNLGVDQLSEFRVSCVAGDQWFNEMKRLANGFAVKVQIAQTTEHALGVVNGYDAPKRLGVDRWLAMLAAFNDSRSACCIIDAGSALTIDRISHQGVHLGGLIVPGLRLTSQVLLDNTGKLGLKKNQMDAQPDVLGHNTEQAVGNGCLTMLVALVNHCMQQFLTEQPCEAVVYLTGGDANTLRPYLHNPVNYQAQLVLDGLQQLDKKSLYVLT